jgi:hypothetical protein
MESVERQQAHDLQRYTGKPSQHRAVRIIDLLPLLISGLCVSCQMRRLQGRRKGAYKGGLSSLLLTSGLGYGFNQRVALIWAPVRPKSGPRNEEAAIVGGLFYALSGRCGEGCSQLRVFIESRQNAGCSKWHPIKAAGSSATEAYPCGTLQGDERLRTPMGDIFSIPAMCPFPRMRDTSLAPSSAYRSSSPCRRV